MDKDEAGKGQSLVDAMHKENEGKEEGAAGAEGEEKGDANTTAKENAKSSQVQDNEDVEAKFKQFEISGENNDEIREMGTNGSENKSDKKGDPKVPSNPRFYQQEFEGKTVSLSVGQMVVCSISDAGALVCFDMRSEV